MKVNKKICSVLCVMILFLEIGQIRLMAQSAVSDEEYRVGVEDVLFLSVPARPDLNREITVNSSGSVEVPILGNVPIQGLTIEEIERKILPLMQDYYPSIREIEITIVRRVSQVVYVLGQVKTPGKYSFTTPPTLWEAVREAGGPTVTASLNDVRIIKDRAKGGHTTVVQVQEALELGQLDRLPELESGDTVIIPEKGLVYTGQFGVSVFGAVLKPGSYKLEGRKDLLSAILTAGGPLDIASLTKVQVIRHETDGSVSTTQIDLNRYFNEGDPSANPLLQPMDTVNIPAQNRFLYTMKSASFVVSILTAGISLAALFIALDSSNRR